MNVAHALYLRLVQWTAVSSAPLGSTFTGKPAAVLWCCSSLLLSQAMERIHAILPDGTIVRDVEVFRRLYEVVGLGWVYAITKNPSVLNAANAVYGVWAKYRTQITGREALEVILQRHRTTAAATAGSLCRSPDGSTSSASCQVPVKPDMKA